MPAKLRIAAISGGHRFDVPAFTDLLRQYADTEVYFFHLEQWVQETATSRASFGVVLYYQFQLEHPSPELQEVLREPTNNGQGVCILHHALLCYPDWEYWSHLTAMRNRKFYPPSPKEQQLTIQVANRDHPITRGLEEYPISDEIYLMDDTVTGDTTLLLRTDHPAGQNAVAWAHEVEGSRVFCLASGHDATAYGNGGFIEVLGRGLRWCGVRPAEEPLVPAHGRVLKLRGSEVVVSCRPVPVCGPTGLLCRTLYTGVTNGTERRQMVQNRDTPGEVAKGGYQHVARVLEKGRLVQGFEVGDLIFSGEHRGHHEYFLQETVTENPLHTRLPAGANLREAAFYGMAAIAMHDVRRVDTRLGDRVLVVGAGPIGQLISQCARAAGAATTVCDIDEGRLELARRTGAEHTVCTRDAARWEELKANPFHTVFETSGAPVLHHVLGEAWHGQKVLRRRGRLVLVALREEVQYPHFAGHSLEVEIHHVSHFCLTDLLEVIRLAASGTLQIEPLIQEELRLDQAGWFYNRLLKEPAATGGTIFNWETQA